VQEGPVTSLVVKKDFNGGYFYASCTSDSIGKVKISEESELQQLLNNKFEI
jgi:hypothetical protein